MNEILRRKFLGRSTRRVFALGAAALAAPRPSRAAANEKVRMAAIGVGGRCFGLVRGFVSRGDVDMVTLCDVYPQRDRLLAASKLVADKQGKAPSFVQDYRRVLDDKSIDAVIVGTPDHWHGPMSIFACQAEKDVYVEKPPSHNVWEGRKMVEAARRYKRVVQVGTQNRSAVYAHKALEFIQSGALGTIHLCKVYNMKQGSPYQLKPNGEPRAGMDYDTWLGPVQSRPYNDGICYRGGWHKFWDFSGGDIADDGIHQLDLARYLVGKGVPKAVHATGGNLAFQDDREVPDVQMVSYQYDDLVMTLEASHYTSGYMRKTGGSIRQGNTFPYWYQNATRIELYGTKNLLVLGRHGGGWQAFTAEGKVVDECYGYHPDPDHKENFIQCIRSRQRPNSDVEIGHESTVLVHLANIAYRVGHRRLEFDAKSEQFGDDTEANRLLKRDYREKFRVPEIV